MWEKQLIETKNGQFEIFVAGEGEPLCITAYPNVKALAFRLGMRVRSDKWSHF